MNLKTNQTLLIILDPIRLQNGPRLIADLSFYATVPFFDSSRQWQFHEKKIPKFHENHEIFQIYLNLWPTISAQTVHEGLTATSRIILYLKQMDIHDNSIIYLMIQKQNPEY